MKRKKKRVTVVQWRAAVDLLCREIGRSHTLLAQIANDPMNMKLMLEIPHVVNGNRFVMSMVMKKVSGK